METGTRPVHALAQVLMGSKESPEDGHHVARLCYWTAITYAV